MVRKNIIIQDGSNVYFTSDTHFQHGNIIKFCNRPYSNVEEMNNAIIENWNSVVGPNDIVFHLGDFAWSGSWHKGLDKLIGKIYLILGNHDIVDFKNSYQEKFEGFSQQICINIEGQRVLLNHFPILCYPDKCWQLFGHCHTVKSNNTGSDFNKLSNLSPTQYEVGVDFNDYRPISWKEIKEKIQFQVDNKVNMLYWVNC